MTDQAPEGYEECAAMIIKALTGAKSAGVPMPRFRLLPTSATSERGICLDAEAHGFVLAMVVTALKKWNTRPTYMMLRMALDEAGVPYEECSLADLGLTVGSA